jgi:signal transduction histidine kinase
MNPAPEPGPTADILVVDDTPANLRLLESMLRERGHRVRSFPRGQLALAAAGRRVPDLVLLDVAMPGMDGYEVCRRMKADPRLAEVPVIFVSARAETADKVRAFESGGVDYVTKPFQVDEVCARVATHLALRRLQARVERQNEELKASYERLRELELLRSDLVHMVVHDLRAPLMVVGGYLSLALKGLGRGGLREHLRGAQRGAQRLSGMVNTILDVARLEANEVPLRREPVDLGGLAREAMAGVSPLADGQRLRWKGARKAAPCACDAELVRRVLVNLLDNALKFTPSGGTVWVSSRAARGRVGVEVRDSGPGVPKEMRARVFEKFAAVGKRGARPSTGLGLNFCKLAVEAHGGAIGVDGGRAGGACFWFELPRGAKLPADAGPGG